jgi:hypothetical protein
MAERTKITEIWACVGDDGSGTGEGILSCLSNVPENVRRAAPSLPRNLMAYVLSLAYDRETMKLAVAASRKSGRPFRVLHFTLDGDVTAEFE